MVDNQPNDKERIDLNPAEEFTTAECALISGLVETTNDALEDGPLGPRRAAQILRATADCVEREGTDTPTVSYRLREALATPGSALPADALPVESGGGERP